MSLDIFADMFPKDEISDVKILHELLDEKSNLNMKTRVTDPIALTLLDISVRRFERMKLKKSAKLLEDFSKVYKALMVSYPDGEGRKEVTDAIASIRQDKIGQNLTERFLGMKRE